jgi:hypothetical protein
MNSGDVLSTLLALQEIIEEVLRELAAEIPASTFEFASVVFLFTRRN